MDEYSLLSAPFRGAHDKSKGFESFIRGIGDSKSKHEEDKVVKQELVYLKEQAVSANITSKQTRELLIRLAYCEMLGHDASFGHIHAIKFAQQTNLLEKRTGYLAASIFLQKDNQLVVLLINTLQKDLKSTNVVAKSTALNVICKLIDADMIPALLPLIIAALKDKRVEIRKKALMTLQRVYTIKPSLLQNIGRHLSNAMADPDPCVVASSLHFFYDLIKKSPDNYRKYLTAFLQILTQILEGKLSEFNYHGVQAPWIRIKLLKILALLGKQHKSASETMSPVLLQMIDALPTDCNIGCAVVFECIQTITTIYALKPLLDAAFKKTALFLTSSSSDMKCLGITAMTALVELDLSYAGDPKQQEIILNCLDDEDSTMRKKTVELLYKIANTENVVLVSAKLLDHLRSKTEHYIKEDVVMKLTELAEKYAPDPMWYVETINDVISAAPGFVNTELPHRLMKLIATAENDENFKTSTVSRYIKLIRKKTLPDALVHISCWVIGEYAYLVQDKHNLSDVLERLTALLDRRFSDPTTRGWIVTAVAKLTARIGTYSPEARGMIDRYRTGCPAELRQRCHEVNILATDMQSMACAFPVDSSQDDIKVCPSLSFLDEYVYHALSADALPYRQHMKNFEDEPREQTDKTEIQITPYEHPFKNITTKAGETKIESEKNPSNPVNETSPGVDKVTPVTKPPGRKTSKPTPPPAVWGKTGYTGRKIGKKSEQSEALKSSVGSSSKSSSGSIHEQHPSKSVDKEKIQDNVVRQRPSDEHGATDESHAVTSAFFSGITKRLPPQKTSRVDPRDTMSQSSLTAEPTVEQTGASTLLMDVNDEPIEPVSDGIGVTSTEEALTKEHVMSLADVQVENFLETDNEDDTCNTRTIKEGLLVELDSENDETLLMSTSHFDVHQENSAAAVFEPAVSHDDNDCTAVAELLRPTQDSLQHFDHNIEICSDSNVRLVYSTRHNATELILSFKLTNQCQARTAVEQVAMTIEPPSNLVSDVDSRSVAVETLAFLDNVTQNLPLTCQYPATHMSFKGTLNYVISRTPKVLHFRQEIAWRELLRPLDLTTEGFGEKWTTMSNDIRQKVASTLRKSCEETMDGIAQHMNFTVVDIIGCEGIAAATVLGKDLCLLHCKFLGDTEIWVKTASKLSSEITMRECISFLKKITVG